MEKDIQWLKTPLQLDEEIQSQEATIANRDLKVVVSRFASSAEMKSDHKKRNSPISIRFTEEERALLKK